MTAQKDHGDVAWQAAVVDKPDSSIKLNPKNDPSGTSAPSVLGADVGEFATTPPCARLSRSLVIAESACMTLSTNYPPKVPIHLVSSSKSFLSFCL